jgi:hypothetical protein
VLLCGSTRLEKGIEMGTSAVVSSANVAEDRFAVQAEPVKSQAASSVSGSRTKIFVPGFKNVQDVPMDPSNAQSEAHPNIVKAEFDGDADGNGKGEVRYLVYAQSSNSTFAFATENEARAFVSYASASAFNGKGAALGQSTDASTRSSHLNEAKLMKAAGYGSNVRAAMSEQYGGVGSMPKVTINGDQRVVYEIKEGFTETLLQYDYSEFAGTGIPSLPSEAVAYLQNTFKTIPTDPTEFELQLSALKASAQTIYKHNGYNQGPDLTKNTLDVNANQEVSKLVSQVFFSGLPNAGHLNTLRLMGLATAGDGGGDNFGNWTLTQKGRDILGGIDNFAKNNLENTYFLPSLALANIESSKGFVTASKMDTFILTDNSTGTASYSFKAKADAQTPGNYTFADVQAQLKTQYEVLQPDLGATPPIPLRDGLLIDHGVAANMLLKTLFGTNSLDESHANAAIAAGLITAGGDAGSGATSLTTTALGDWLMTQSAAKAA